MNGAVQAPVYSHVNTQQLAPRGYATKAKPVSSKGQGSPGKSQSSPSKVQSSPNRGQLVPVNATPSRTTTDAETGNQDEPIEGQLITDIDSIDQISDYKPQKGKTVYKETLINSEPAHKTPIRKKQNSSESDGSDGHVKEKGKGQNVVIIEVSTERKSPNTSGSAGSSGRKTPTSNVVELFDAKTDGTLIF